MQRPSPSIGKYSFSDFSVSPRGHAASVRQKQMGKGAKPARSDYVSLNLNVCLSRFPTFGSSWCLYGARPRLLALHTITACTHVRERGRIVFRFECADGLR